MKGKIVEKDDKFYVEYIVIGAEADEVEKRYVRLASWVSSQPGDEVEFECNSGYTISGEEVATIKTKQNEI